MNCFIVLCRYICQERTEHTQYSSTRQNWWFIVCLTRTLDERKQYKWIVIDLIFYIDWLFVCFVDHFTFCSYHALCRNKKSVFFGRGVVLLCLRNFLGFFLFIWFRFTSDCYIWVFCVPLLSGCFLWLILIAFWCGLIV